MSYRQFLLFAALLSGSQVRAIEFNATFLNIDGNSDVNLEQFARANYTVPGKYLLDVAVNRQFYAQQSIEFKLDDNQQDTYPCLPEQLVAMFGLKEKIFAELPRTAVGSCVRLDAMDSVVIKYVKRTGRLTISIPQAAFEYDDPNYIPPAGWSNGVDGLLLDYRVIANTRRSNLYGNTNQVNTLSSYGTAGANFGAWRLRADYQAQNSSGDQNFGSDNKAFQLNRLYAFRALPGIRSNLSVGDNYLNSDVFDTFALRGATLSSDDRMLPPNLRGYAPLITGVARTNATVTVAQQGRVLYSTKVTPGAFSIQNLNSSVQGTLDVTVQEEDGSEQKFTVATAAVPFLSRQGEMRYKVSAGQPRLFGVHGITPTFTTAEIAYGLPFDWTVYGGMIAASGYTALAMGTGKDFGAFGALSADITNSRAKLWWNGQNTSGNSYRLNYSKHFDGLDTDLRFFGYRFSDRTFTNFSQFVGDPSSYSFNAGKQRYSVALAKRISGVSTTLSYDHSTFWDVKPTDRFGVSLARTIAIGTLKNISLNFSAYRSKDYTGNTSQAYAGLTIPLGTTSMLSTNMQSSSYGGTSTTVGYSGDNGDGVNYQMYGGVGASNPYISGYVGKKTSFYRANASISADSNNYSAASAEIDGSVVLTKYGVTPHGNGSNGDTRLLVSTDGVSDVAFSGQVRSNRNGYAVIDSLPAFQAYDARVNMNKLPLNTDVGNPVRRLVLTDGAIGYVNFSVARGRNAYIILSLASGRDVPFGASVQDKTSNKEVGIVGEHGIAYLTGVKSDAELVARWGDDQACALAALPQDDGLTGTATPIACQPESLKEVNR
ncbi:type VII secretion system (T7SS), usher family protein [Collimonas arenae]|uniref:Type VII secretion system (T7SS), usher family protein n=1 Tax=Collimonas arenae TaxID=279058 RepID=A0A127QHS3_9BURK|nr:fimbria/pilus outer membrane usher protein [Collimonas arenae]AMP09593.1 type VII secretion system (T7SS), usher family protein [Collimonas arenae]